MQRANQAHTWGESHKQRLSRGWHTGHGVRVGGDSGVRLSERAESLLLYGDICTVQKRPNESAGPGRSRHCGIWWRGFRHWVGSWITWPLRSPRSCGFY